MGSAGREWEGGLKKRAVGLGYLRMTLEEEMGAVDKAGWLSREVVVAVAVAVAAMVKLGFNKMDAMGRD